MAPLFQRIKFEVVGTVALAFASAVCVISAAYALFAVLQNGLGSAGAAGVTALAAAILAAGLAFTVISLGKAGGSNSPVATRRKLDPETLQNLVGVGSALAGMAADLTLQHRLKRKHADRDKRGWKRRSK